MQNPAEKPNVDVDSPSESVEKQAGKGFLMITGAKAWFMVGGASITFGLPFIFSMLEGDGRQLYGQYYDINNALSIFSMVLIGGLLPAVARYAAAQTVCKHSLLASARKVALCLGGVLLAMFGLGSGWYAESRGHPELSAAYLCAGVICFSYSFYAINVGFINGQKRFKTQAILDIIFTSMKVALVLGAALIGYGVLGAFVGFALAAALIAVLSNRKVGSLERNGESPHGFLAFAGWLMLYTLAFNLAFKMDAILLRPALGALMETPSTADSMMGEYGIAVSLSRLPWQSTIALTFVIFPMISEATFTNDILRTQTYVANTLRYALVLICAVALPLIARPDMVFGCLPGYEVGQYALLWLAPAYVFFSLSNLHNTILMSSGRAKTALGLMLLNLTLVLICFQGGFRDVSDAQVLLSRAGQMTLLAFALVTILGVVIIKRTFKSYAPFSSCIRMTLLLLLVVSLSKLWTPEPLWAKVVFLGCLPLLFFLSLWVSGELNDEDKARLKRVLGLDKRRES